MRSMEVVSAFSHRAGVIAETTFGYDRDLAAHFRVGVLESRLSAVVELLCDHNPTLGTQVLAVLANTYPLPTEA